MFGGSSGIGSARPLSAAPPNAVPANAPMTPGDATWWRPADHRDRQRGHAEPDPQRRRRGHRLLRPGRHGQDRQRPDGDLTAATSRPRSRDARISRAATTVTASEPASTDWTW